MRSASVIAQFDIAAEAIADFLFGAVGVGWTLIRNLRIALGAQFQFRNASLVVDDHFVVVAHTPTILVPDAAFDHVTTAAAALAM